MNVSIRREDIDLIAELTAIGSDGSGVTTGLTVGVTVGLISKKLLWLSVTNIIEAVNSCAVGGINSERSIGVKEVADPPFKTLVSFLSTSYSILLTIPFLVSVKLRKSPLLSVTAKPKSLKTS